MTIKRPDNDSSDLIRGQEIKHALIFLSESLYVFRRDVFDGMLGLDSL